MSPEVKDAREACRKIAQLKWRTMPAITSAEFYNCIQLFTSWASLIYTTQHGSTSSNIVFFFTFLNVFPIIKSPKYTDYNTTNKIYNRSHTLRKSEVFLVWGGLWFMNIFHFFLSFYNKCYCFTLCALSSRKPFRFWWGAIASEDDVYWGETRIYHDISPKQQHCGNSRLNYGIWKRGLQSTTFKTK